MLSLLLWWYIYICIKMISNDDNDVS
jgi:hypothetical protein